jgi:dipeptidyl aminopeptidase/acylaminoacyl peptidase
VAPFRSDFFLTQFKSGLFFISGIKAFFSEGHLMRRLLLPLMGLLLCSGCTQAIADRVLIPAQPADRAKMLSERREKIGSRLGDRLKTIQYASFDKTRIDALLIYPEKTPRGVVVVLHGLTDRKESMLSIAEAFADDGYLAVTPDLRAHGDSGGRYTSLGFREKRDMVALLNYLAAEGIDVSHTGVLGGSLGAAVAIQWAGIDPRVKAVVAVASFAELRSELDFFCRTHNISPVKAFLVAIAAQIEGRFSIDDVSPLATIRSISTPVLLAHGRQDDIVPVTESRRLFDAARGPVGLVVVVGYLLNIREALGKKFLRRAIDWVDTYVATDTQSKTPSAWIAKLPNRNFPPIMPLTLAH